MSDQLLAVRARLAGVLARIEPVRELYLTEGETAAELYEAERLAARIGGIAYAMQIVDDVLEGVNS